jgi:hypothetical protein
MRMRGSGEVGTGFPNLGGSPEIIDGVGSSPAKVPDGLIGAVRDVDGHQSVGSQGQGEARGVPLGVEQSDDVFSLRTPSPT